MGNALNQKTDGICSWHQLSVLIRFQFFTQSFSKTNGKCPWCSLSQILHASSWNTYWRCMWDVPGAPCGNCLIHSLILIGSPGAHFVDFWAQCQKMLKSELLEPILWTSEPNARKKCSNRTDWLLFCYLLGAMLGNAQIETPGAHFVDLNKRK